MKKNVSVIMETFGASYMPAGYRGRRLESSDYDKGYLDLLASLTQVGEVSREQFHDTFEHVQKNQDSHFIVVIEDVESGKLAAAGTLLIEQKFIRNCGKVGHIEDIAVSPDFQGSGLGKVLIKVLTDIGRDQHCYKTILDSAEHVRVFYEKCGYATKGHFMTLYYEN